MSNSRITIVLLNWKRPDNLRLLLDRLMTQRERPEIFLWNNGQEFRHEAVTWQVDSSENRYCMPRWWMAVQAKTSYVMTFDDDLAPTDNDLIGDVVTQLEAQKDKHVIVGAFGKVLVPDLAYEQCPAAVPGTRADIILGRVMALNTSMLRKKLHWERHQEERTTDDILVSALLAGATVRKHFCSPLFRGRLEELPDDYALCKEEDHFKRREESRRRMFSI